MDAGIRESDAGNARRHRRARLFAVLASAAALAGVVALVVLLLDAAFDGARELDAAFLTSFASRFPERAGILAPLAGSLWLLLLTAVLAFPVGVGAAVYLEEYAPRNVLTRLVQLNLANLAGVPSIVYGLLGLALFVRALALDRSLLSGALTLAILVLPIIIITAQEALRSVPQTIREGAYALGATRWQVVSRQVLPVAFPGILTGTVLALARAVGETAPLIMVGAVGFVAFLPTSPADSFTALPLQIFLWISRPQEEFHALAAAAILVLLGILFVLNGVAIVLRNHTSRRV